VVSSNVRLVVVVLCLNGVFVFCEQYERLDNVVGCCLIFGLNGILQLVNDLLVIVDGIVVRHRAAHRIGRILVRIRHHLVLIAGVHQNRA